MNENMIKVYVKLDENNVVIAINSSVFLHDASEWVEIDEGHGDKFAHAQGNYLEKGLTDENGKYNYKWYRKKLVVLSDEEKEALFPTPTPQPTSEERLEALESAMLEMILGGTL